MQPKTMNGPLGDYGDYDDANAFGLGADGRPVGLNPMWGSTGAAALGTLTAVGVRQFTAKDKWSELIGFGAAAVPSVAMIFPKRTRAAGWSGLITAMLTNGVRFVECMVSDKEKAKAEVGATITKTEDAGAQAPAVTPDAAANGQTQGVDIQRIPAFAGAQLGLVTPQATRALNGAAGPQLLGQGRSQGPQLMGAQTGSGMSGHWGSHHFNKS